MAFVNVDTEVFTLYLKDVPSPGRGFVEWRRIGGTEPCYASADDE